MRCLTAPCAADQRAFHRRKPITVLILMAEGEGNMGMAAATNTAMARATAMPARRRAGAESTRCTLKAVQQKRERLPGSSREESLASHHYEIRGGSRTV